MSKREMVDEVIRDLGFENKWTIWFCELAEVLTESQLLNAFILIPALLIFSLVLSENARALPKSS